MDDVLNQIFDIPTPTTTNGAGVLVSSSGPLTPTPLPTPVVVTDEHAADLDEDVDYAREQLKEVIDNGRSAINGALELAQQSDKPTGYSVVGELIQSVTAAVETLVGVHKTRKEAKKFDKEADHAAGGSGSPVINIDKAVFTGRASDLLRELQAVKKQQQDEQVIEVEPVKAPVDASEQ